VLRDAERVYASPIIARLEAQGEGAAMRRGARVIYRNASPDADPRRLVLFGDSYANFVTEAASGVLTPMLAETFREFHFVWSSSVDWAYVERVRPDILVTEISERFMARVPVDGLAVDGGAEDPLIS
jgi:alginate O-acetyltransferase complex protein AlgJ